MGVMLTDTAAMAHPIGYTPKPGLNIVLILLILATDAGAIGDYQKCGNEQILFLYSCYMTTVHVEGLDHLIRKLDDLQSLHAAIYALRAAASHIRGKVNVYPPTTIANSPGNPSGKWYERGYGSRWIRKRAGGVGGSKTSEMLGRRWTTAQRMGGLQQVIGNNVSYGKYVQSRADQAGFHKARGWKAIEDVVEQETDTILKFVQTEIDKALSK